MGRVRRRRWFIGGLAAEAILLAVELSTGGTVVITSGFVVPPLLVALYASPDETAIVGAAGTIASVVAIAFRQWVDLEWVIPFLVVTLGAVIAWFTALARANAGRSTYELGLLAEVGEVADGRAGLEETIRRVTELAVPELASCCCIDAIADDGSIRRIAANVASDTPNREAMEAALLRRRVAPVGSTEAARSGQPIVLESVAHTFPHLAADATDRRIFEQAGWGPGVFLPLYARGRRIGVVSLIRRAGEEFDPRTIRFTQVLAGRVGAALDNAGLSAELSGIERRLDAILDNLDEAVTVQDAVTGRTTYANEAAARLLQISPEELMRSDPRDVMDRYEVRAEDGSPIDLEALPAWRLRNGEDPGPMTVRNVVRATGEERWLVNRVTGVTDDAGRLALIVNVIEDVTEPKRAERAQHLLAEVGLVAGHDDPQEMLRTVAEAFVPEWSETCALALVERDRVRPVFMHRGDAELDRRIREIDERWPSRRGGPGPLETVARTGETLVLDVTQDVVRRMTQDEEHARAVLALGTRSVLVVPLAAGPRTVGALSLTSTRPHRFGEAERALAEEVGRRVGLALSGAQLASERAEIARTLQASLLPRPLVPPEGWDVASFYRPVGEANEVGGDFYERWQDDDSWTVVVGDVAGKGARAAALTSLARYTLRTAGRLTGAAGRAFAELNAALVAEPDLSLCTAVAVCLPRRAEDEAVVRVACAGHPRPILVRGGVPEWIEAGGPLLGSYPEGEWPEYECVVRPGDVLLLYTDGVLDVVGEDGERFGEDRLLAALRGVDAGRRYAGSVLATLDQALDAYSVGAARDDSAAVAIAWEGSVGEWRDEVRGDDAAPRVARRRLRDHLATRGVKDHIGEAALVLLSELVTNAVRHGGATPDVPVRVDTSIGPRTLRVEVRDPGRGFRNNRIAPGAHGGFGLRVLERSASRWGVEAGEATLVWFELDLA